MSTRPACGWHPENAAYSQGAHHVAGVDEVGRGPLFGPVVAAAVILSRNCHIPGIDDSKRLSENKRNALEPQIRAEAVSWAIAEVDACTIDQINIRQASLLAMRRAVDQLMPCPDYLLIDGRDTIQWQGRQQALIHGDATSYSIAAASILAKVHRDRLMLDLDRRFPGYGIAQHKGYPCAAHRDALARLGPTPLHRRSYGPVAQLLLKLDSSV